MLCTHLAARGHQVYVLTALFGDLPRMDVQGNLTIERNPLLPHPGLPGRVHDHGLFHPESHLAAAAGSSVHFIPDVIQAAHFAVPAGAAAYVLSGLFRVPYVITAHGGDVPGGAPAKDG